MAESEQRLHIDGTDRDPKRRARRAFLASPGYRGYTPLETLGPGDPRDKLRRFLAEVREALA